MAQPQWKRTKLGYANPTHLISQAPSTANILCLRPSQVLPKLPRDPCSPTTHTHVYAHMHAHSHARPHACTHMCTCTHAYSHRCMPTHDGHTCIHSHTCTLTHVHTHMPTYVWIMPTASGSQGPLSKRDWGGGILPSQSQGGKEGGEENKKDEPI